MYCVSGTVTGKPEPTTTTTTTTSKTTTRPTTSTTTTTTTNVPEPTNEPAIPGIVDNCDGFYKVSSGDQCGTIAADHGISTAQFLEWNTEVNERKPISSSRPKIPPPLARQRSNIHPLQPTECSNLWLDYYVCVHVPSATTGPQPQMAGIISTCTDLLQGPGRRQLLHDPELGGNRPFQLPAVEYGD